MDKQVSDKETVTILELAESCLELDGDFVELGCYRGDTSLLLAQLMRKCCVYHNTCKKLWIYDSFEGLPEKTAEDASAAGAAFRAGELKVSKAEVLLRFKKAGLPLPIAKKGFFEELDPEKDLPEQVAFAFLDGDLYRSIKISLKLAVGRMVEGGIIVVHDYNNPQLPGVARAVDEWIKNSGWKMSRRESLAILQQN